MTELDPFVYLATHDLRAPLMSMKGLLSLMRRDTERKNLDSYFSHLETSINKIDQSITDIIAYSEKESGATPPQEVDFRKIAEESIQSLRYIAGAESFQIDLSVEEGGLFFSYYDSLYSIFNNILSNAIRYRDRNKHSFLKINVTFNSKGAQTIFEDNGIGIEEALQAKIFDKFFRVNHEYGSSGLGLYMVKISTEKLGGSMRIKSRIGEGTTFILQTPNLLAKANHF